MKITSRIIAEAKKTHTLRGADKSRQHKENSTSLNLGTIRNDDLFPGLQKDRHHGTSGAKEGFSSLGRFGKK